MSGAAYCRVIRAPSRAPRSIPERELESKDVRSTSTRNWHTWPSSSHLPSFVAAGCTPRIATEASSGPAASVGMSSEADCPDWPEAALTKSTPCSPRFRLPTRERTQDSPEHYRLWPWARIQRHSSCVTHCPHLRTPWVPQPRQKTTKPPCTAPTVERVKARQESTGDPRALCLRPRFRHRTARRPHR